MSTCLLKPAADLLIQHPPQSQGPYLTFADVYLWDWSDDFKRTLQHAGYRLPPTDRAALHTEVVGPMTWCPNTQAWQLSEPRPAGFSFSALKELTIVVDHPPLPWLAYSPGAPTYVDYPEGLAEVDDWCRQRGFELLRLDDTTQEGDQLFVGDSLLGHTYWCALSGGYCATTISGSHNLCRRPLAPIAPATTAATTTPAVDEHAELAKFFATPAGQWAGFKKSG